MSPPVLLPCSVSTTMPCCNRCHFVGVRGHQIQSSIRLTPCSTHHSCNSNGSVAIAVVLHGCDSDSGLVPLCHESLVDRGIGHFLFRFLFWLPTLLLLMLAFVGVTFFSRSSTVVAAVGATGSNPSCGSWYYWSLCFRHSCYRCHLCYRCLCVGSSLRLCCRHNRSPVMYYNSCRRSIRGILHARAVHYHVLSTHLVVSYSYSRILVLARQCCRHAEYNQQSTCFGFPLCCYPSPHNTISVMRS
jgi:hypothetical protein